MIFQNCIPHSRLKDKSSFNCTHGVDVVLPDKKQYRKWTLPSKYSLWSIVIGIIGLMIAIYTLFPDKSILEAVAEEEYRPNVKIVDVKSVQWLGDKEKFLTIYFNNESKGPARKFQVELFDDNKKLIFSKSDSTSTLFSGNLLIKANQELGFALSAISEFKSFLNSKGRNGELLGFGLDSKTPIKITEKMTAKYISKDGGYYSVNAYPIFVKYTYEGITNSSGEAITGIYAYMDDTNKG